MGGIFAFVTLAPACHNRLVQTIMDLAAKERLFAKEYSRLFDRLYRYVRVRVKSPHDAEDLVSEVILAGYRTLETYDPAKGSLEQWLMGVAKFKLIAFWKKTLLTVDLEAIDELIGDVPDTASIDSALAWSQVMEKIPPEYQALFTMRFSLDMTHEEIAEVIGKTPDAVRQLFSRFIRKLRLELVEAEVV